MRSPVLLLAALVLSAALPAGRAADPTRSPEELADALRAQAAKARQVEVRGLAVSGDGTGTALLRLPDGAWRAVRAGDAFEAEADGVAVPFRVVSVGPDGVALDAPTLPGGTLPLHGEFPAWTGTAPEAASDTADASFLRVFSVEDVPARLAFALLGSAAGIPAVVSSAAGEPSTTLSLRGVPGAKAAEAICDALGLWAKTDASTGALRVQTVEEYQRELGSFREERTETFTLLYPNVVEVASVLYGLFPDRVYLTLGERDILDDGVNELARRFERLRAIDDAGRNSSYFNGVGSIQAPNAGAGFDSRSNGGFGRSSALPGGTGGGADFEDLTRSELARAEAAGGDVGRAVLDAHRARKPSIFVTVSRNNNLIVVRTGDAAAMEQIRAIVARLNVPTPAVLLEMKVVEFTSDDSFESTFEYQFLGQSRSNGNIYDHSGGFPGFAPLANVARTDMFGYQLLSEHLNARIQMLEKNGKARTLATPVLLVANNEVSRVFIGDEMPITTGVSLRPVSSTSSTGITTVTGYSVEPQTSIRSIGTSLIVSASINADGTVTLQMLEEESAVVRNGGSIPYGDASSLQSFPVDTVESRRVSGTFFAANDRVAAIGGLIRESERDEVSRVPLLGHLPLLGFLFRSTNRVKERSELVVFVRPHVFSTPADGEAASRSAIDRVARTPDLPSVFDDAGAGGPDGFPPADLVERAFEGRAAAAPRPEPLPEPEAAPAPTPATEAAPAHCVK